MRLQFTGRTRPMVLVKFVGYSVSGNTLISPFVWCAVGAHKTPRPPEAPNPLLARDPLLAGVFQSSGRFAWPPLMELWPPLMELARDQPTDQIVFSLDSEAFQSSIGRRDQCLGRFPFVFGCAKDRTERKRRPSPELRSA